MTQHSVLNTQKPSACRAMSQTPLHHWHSAHGARFLEKDGWQIPTVYRSVEQEVAAARFGLGISDLSAWGKVSLSGPGTATAVRELVGSDPAAKPGAVAHLSVDAGILACRLADDQLLLLTSRPDITATKQRLTSLANVRGCV